METPESKWEKAWKHFLLAIGLAIFPGAAIGFVLGLLAGIVFKTNSDPNFINWWSVIACSGIVFILMAKHIPTIIDGTYVETPIKPHRHRDGYDE